MKVDLWMNISWFLFVEFVFLTRLHLVMNDFSASTFLCLDIEKAWANIIFSLALWMRLSVNRRSRLLWGSFKLVSRIINFYFVWLKNLIFFNFCFKISQSFPNVKIVIFLKTSNLFLFLLKFSKFFMRLSEFPEDFQNFLPNFKFFSWFSIFFPKLRKFQEAPHLPVKILKGKSSCQSTQFHHKLM